jgi:hypothetical protein
MPVTAAIGTTTPRFGSFIGQTGVRVTRYSGRVDWSRLFWVGFLALFRGFSQIMLAFSIRHAGEEAAAIDPARPR